jgi:hypothetical protein
MSARKQFLNITSRPKHSAVETALAIIGSKDLSARALPATISAGDAESSGNRPDLQAQASQRGFFSSTLRAMSTSRRIASGRGGKSGCMRRH